jgi:DNA-binding GntR family transcriptional regulator
MDGKTLKNNARGSQEIAGELMAGIASGTYRSGQRLVELQLSEVYDVKRNRIREALRQLEQDGFVKIIPNVGAIVVEFSQKDIEQTYDLLSVLEGLAARVATPFITAHELEKLEDLIIRMEATDTPSLFLEVNVEFHALLTMLSENDRLIKFVDNLRYLARRFGFPSMHSPGQIRASIDEHRKIFEAIKAVKPMRVEQCMRHHLIRSKNRLIKYLNRSL